MGAGALYLRRERRRRDGEAAIRSLLHQEHVDRARSLRPRKNRQDRPYRKRRAIMSSSPGAESRVLNAMTIDVEDYFHVSVFDGVLPRSRWETLESRVCRNTDRLLDIFAEYEVQGTFF